MVMSISSSACDCVRQGCGQKTSQGRRIPKQVCEELLYKEQCLLNQNHLVPLLIPQQVSLVWHRISLSGNLLVSQSGGRYTPSFYILVISSSPRVIGLDGHSNCSWSPTTLYIESSGVDRAASDILWIVVGRAGTVTIGSLPETNRDKSLNDTEDSCTKMGEEAGDLLCSLTCML